MKRQAAGRRDFFFCLKKEDHDQAGAGVSHTPE
jgi:hypothetical protein